MRRIRPTVVLAAACLVACRPAEPPPRSAGDASRPDPREAPAARPDASLPDEAAPAPPCVEMPSWFDLASALADRETLGRGLRDGGYEIPPRAHVLAARVVKGAGQPAFAYLSLGDTGFASSESRYWPASAVKLIAALGALHALGERGLTGDAAIEFTDGRGTFRKTVDRLYEAALVRSSNPAYDRLVRLAGRDELNLGFLAPERGFRHAALQRAYDPATGDPHLAESPAVAYREGDLAGEIPARSSSTTLDRCGPGSNCVSLFELLDSLSRVVLHDEIPESDRFRLAPRDVRRLRSCLLKAPSAFDESAREALGHPVRIYNKRGYVPGRDVIDHALIVDETTGERYLLAATLPFEGRDREAALAALADLGRRALRILRDHEPDGPLLQRDAGVPLAFEAVNAAGGEIAISVSAGAGVERMELFHGRERLAVSEGSRVEALVAIRDPGEILVAQAWGPDGLLGASARLVTPGRDVMDAASKP